MNIRAMVGGDPFVSSVRLCGGKRIFLLMVDYGVMLIDTYIEPKSYLVSILLTAGCYFGSLWLLRLKVKRVNMIESLKDNRE